jgi:hypothetical protein
MCFSESASFIASGGLAAAGVASMRIAPRPHQKLIAALPFLFAIQQFIEGWQWHALNAGSPSIIAGYMFLFFAFLLWPLYIPITVWVLDKKRRKMASFFVAAGAVLASLLGYVLVTEPLNVHACGHSIAYTISLSFNSVIIFLYFLVVAGVLMFSSRPELRWFGVLITSAAAITAFFYFSTLTSVSCFFCAILSSLIYFYLRYQRGK